MNCACPIGFALLLAVQQVAVLPTPSSGHYPDRMICLLIPGMIVTLHRPDDRSKSVRVELRHPELSASDGDASHMDFTRLTAKYPTLRKEAERAIARYSAMHPNHVGAVEARWFSRRTHKIIFVGKDYILFEATDSRTALAQPTMTAIKSERIGSIDWENVN